MQIPLTWRDLEAREGQRDFSLADAQIEGAGGRLQDLRRAAAAVDKWSLPDWMYMFGEDDDRQLSLLRGRAHPGRGQPLSRPRASVAIARLG